MVNKDSSAALVLVVVQLLATYGALCSRWGLPSCALDKSNATRFSSNEHSWQMGLKKEEASFIYSS